MRARTLLVAVAAFSLSGCYHATIETGLATSADSVHVPWAHSFVYGLVPPATVSAAAKCKNGVAKVETQHSFLNGLVYILTWGLYSPVTITVTCSNGQRASVENGATINVGSNPQTAVQQAAELARETGNAVFLKF